jgi:hypothetical protein
VIRYNGSSIPTKTKIMSYFIAMATKVILKQECMLSKDTSLLKSFQEGAQCESLPKTDLFSCCFGCYN